VKTFFGDHTNAMKRKGESFTKDLFLEITHQSYEKKGNILDKTFYYYFFFIWRAHYAFPPLNRFALLRP